MGLGRGILTPTIGFLQRGLGLTYARLTVDAIMFGCFCKWGVPSEGVVEFL